jgi:hypothetical protein
LTFNAISTNSEGTTTQNNLFFTGGSVGVDTDTLSDLTNYNTPDVVREALEIYQGNINMIDGYHLK